MIFSIILANLIIANFTSQVHSEKPHKRMTDDEIRSVFRCEPEHVDTLNYEEVQIFLTDEVHKRTTVTLNSSIYNEYYTLYLEENDHVLYGSNTPVYLANVDAHNRVSYSKGNIQVLEAVKTYTDKFKRAAFTVVKDSEDRIQVEGTIGDNLFIRSLPDDFSSNGTQHIIIKRNEEGNPPLYTTSKKPNPYRIDYKIIREGMGSVDYMLNKSSLLRSDFTHYKKLNTQDETLYPEILVIVDYETYRYHLSDWQRVLRYMAAFWNAVDLRFREMNKPKIRLNIAGFIIAQHPNAMPYFNHFYNGEKNNLDASSILSHLYGYMASLVENDKPPITLGSFDIIVGMTSRDLWYNGVRARGIETPTPANCKSVIPSTILIKDWTPDFHGVVTAAHEISHALGAEHDPNTKDCLNSKNFIMSNTGDSGKSVMYWSKCSYELMLKFFSSDNAKCFRNKPNVGRPYSKRLLGDLFSREEQCQMNWKNPRIKGVGDDCNNLECVSESGESISGTGYPAEGTKCGQSLICLKGKCVSDQRKWAYRNPLYLTLHTPNKQT